MPAKKTASKSTPAKHSKMYIVQVALTDDASKQNWVAGEIITDADFPAQVIENWLELGVLVEEGKETSAEVSKPED